MKQKLLLLLMFTFYMWQTKAQTGLTCATSKTIAPNTSTAQIDSSGVIWYSFVADSTHENLSIASTSGNHVIKIEVYSGTCSSLIFYAKDSVTSGNDIIVRIDNNTFVKGTKYYVKAFYNTGLNSVQAIIVLTTQMIHIQQTLVRNIHVTAF